MQIGCTILMILTHACPNTNAASFRCQTLVTTGYLTWPSQTNAWCQRQCSCCNLGQAIYKASSQVQAQGARGRQRDGRIKECLQGKETNLQSVGEKERGKNRGAQRARMGRDGIKVVSRWVKIERDRLRGREEEREREGSSQVQRTAWIPEDELTRPSTVNDKHK